MIALLLLALQDGGPYTHTVESATSRDGLQWTAERVTLLKHSSVPSALVMPDGKIRLYYVDAENVPENVNCVESVDGGKTFRKTSFVIQGLSRLKAVDPCPVLLENGKVRLYYYGSAENPDGPGGHSIFSALSDDGIRFREEKAVFTREGLVDPDVFWNGREWIMHVFSLSEPGTVVAKSSDGLDFQYFGMLQPARIGVTAPVRLPDGTFRMYGFDQGRQENFVSLRSKDGLSWTKEDGVRLTAPEGKEITDPFVVRLSDGTWKMYYKLSNRRRRP